MLLAAAQFRTYTCESVTEPTKFRKLSEGFARIRSKPSRAGRSVRRLRRVDLIDPGAYAAADMDGDGHIDIATASDEGSMDFLWNNGAGGSHPVERHETPRFVLFMDLGDIDGDGKIDVAALTHNGLLFFVNRGSRLFAGRLEVP